jgi:hypothetical protein
MYRRLVGSPLKTWDYQGFKTRMFAVGIADLVRTLPATSGTDPNPLVDACRAEA